MAEIKEKICSYGGPDCGTPTQLCGPDRVCPKHWRRKERWGSYDPQCIVGGDSCGKDVRLYGEGKCRKHHYYADPLPCIEEGCDRTPSAEYNKFVGGRCEMHYQAHRAAERRAGQQCVALDRGDCGPAERLYAGLCRKHYERQKITGSLDPAVCNAEGCDVTYDTDPSGQFKGGMCNMHYLRKLRGEERRNDLGTRLCPHCGSDMSFARRNSRYCSVTCQTSAWNVAHIDLIRITRRINIAKRKANKQGNLGYQDFGMEEWLDLLETTEYRCTYCGVIFPADELEMDHIVSLAGGGPHCLSNITPACGSCNSSKHARVLLVEWAPKLLGGRPRWDKSKPRGERRNEWKAADWRDSYGPRPEVLDRASPYPELVRAIWVSEVFFAEPD